MAPVRQGQRETSDAVSYEGYLFGALGAVLFSLKAVLIKLAYLPGGGLVENQLDTITLLALRMGFALPVYVLIGVLVLRARAKAGRALPSFGTFAGATGLGVLGYYICSYTDFYGLKFITAQLERLLLFTYPVFVFILGALFFGSRFSWSGVAALAVSYGGIALIFGGGEIATGANVPLGAALILVCAFLFSVFQLFAKSKIDTMGSLLFTCTAMISAGIMALVHFTGLHVLDGKMAEALDLPPRIFILAGLIAFFSTLLPSFLINAAVARIGPAAVASLGLLGPVATIAAAIVLLGEPFGPVDAAGTLLTLIGIGIYSWLDQRHKKAAIKAALVPIITASLNEKPS